MNIEVLVSTMNLKNQENFIKKENVKSSVVINQVNDIELKNVTEGNNRLYSYQEKGLSRSRNRAIENSRADICVIADDDIRYEDNYEEIIKKGYEKYPDADIIAFYVDNVDDNKKRPIRKEGKINLIKSMRIQSVQLTFKRKSILNNNITFNENFGTGTELYMGEENIFLAECLRKKLKIYYIPQKIATIQDNESTWFKGYNEYDFNVKGAVYYAMSKKLYPIFILQFAIRKIKFYANEVKPVKAIKYMFKGTKKYKNSIKKKVYFMGDFCLTTGPAIVNKNYEPYMKKVSYICKTNSKIIRPLHFIFFIKRCDVLLISGLSKFHVKAAKIAKKMGKRVVYLMHGYNKVEYEINEVPIEKGTLRRAEDEMFQMADKIVCVSEKFCEFMKEQRKDIKNKFEFVNSGIEINNEESEKKERKNSTFTIVSVGGGVKNKNNLSVCKAINNIKDKDIKFIVIGRIDKDGEKIKEFNFVEYYEFLPHEEVLKVMGISDLYIQNSYFETFGLAVVEAISMGCKILVSKNLGVLSILDNIDETNIIQNNEDIEEIKLKVENLLRNEDEMCYIKDVDKHTWKESSEKLIKLLK